MQHGIIEGFYGKPWGFAKRTALIPFYKQYDYRFFLYAPKADVFLREQWQQCIPAPLLEQLIRFGRALKKEHIAWGVGLSPFNLHLDFNHAAKEQLKRKINELVSLEINWLAILFDDMQGDVKDLAKMQIEICHYVASLCDLDKLILCPSYYSFDPVLEKVFGKMPDNYLQDLGKGLDGCIDIFWTGEKVCSTAYSREHLLSVQSLLGRKPFIWDNYPVNDGARMSPFLHLAGFEGRESCSEDTVSGLAVNPMNEAFLSQLPMATLAECLASPANYDARRSFEQAAKRFMGKAADTLGEDLPLFQKQGLHQLSEQQKQALKKKYNKLIDAHNQPCIEELLAFLDGQYLSDVKDSVPTQLLWQ
jgi:hyaluronoglucosaminidase